MSTAIHYMYKHEILITLCGMSPAVITETVYCLLNSTPETIPDEVIAITTDSGRNAIHNELIDSGIWNKMLADIGVPPGKCGFGSSDSIKVIPCLNGSSDTDDIITSEDNEATANFMLEVLRRYTENPDTRLIFSIAGGRKTMSALGALTMSMLGRSQDKLCHVLASSPFDNPLLEPRFYYPDASQKKYRLPSGKSIGQENISPTLCEIPFVRLRYLFQKQHLRLPGTFMDTVELANAVIHPEFQKMPELLMRPETMGCAIDDRTIALNAAEFALYWLLATRCKNGLPPLRGQKTLHDEFIAFSDSISSSVMPEIINHNRFGNKTEDDMRKLISSISGKLREAMGLMSTLPYCLPSRGAGIYGVALPTSSITCPRNYG